MSILQHSHLLAGLSAWVPLQAGLNGGPYSLRDAPVNPSGQVGLWAILIAGIYNEPASLSGWGWQNRFQGWHSLLARDLNQAELSTEFSDQRRKASDLVLHVGRAPDLFLCPGTTVSRTVGWAMQPLGTSRTPSWARLGAIFYSRWGFKSAFLPRQDNRTSSTTGMASNAALHFSKAPCSSCPCLLVCCFTVLCRSLHL